jgi:hypothetical protein
VLLRPPIVLPKEIAAELLERLKQHHASNVAYFESVRRGEFSNQWVDRVLEEQGCLINPASEFHDVSQEASSENDGWLRDDLA